MTKNGNKKIKNPLLDIVDEEVSKIPVSTSFFEKIGLISILIISVGIFVLSIISLIVDIFIKFNFGSVLIDMIFMVVSLIATYFIFNILRRRMVTELLVDTAFQEGVYSKLQPLIDNIASAQTGNDIMLDRISKIDLKVENILKEKRVGSSVPEKGRSVTDEYIALGTTVKFVIKSIFMIVITMAIFMFLVNFNLGGITPYATLSIFILWWLFITNEYDLWRDSSAWSMVFFPILIIPATFIILSNILNYNVLMALLYLLLGLYSTLYYTWAVYVSTGSLPFLTRREFGEREIAKSEREEFFASQQKGLLQQIFKEVKNAIRKRG